MCASVLITGATGFIGGHLAERLVRKGDRVSCLVRASSSLRWLKDLPLEYNKGEVTDPSSLIEAVRGIEVIYHLASVTKAVRPDDYYRINAGGTRNLLDACRRAGPGLRRFILVSSLAAVGPSTHALPLDEDSPPHPITDYGRSKLEAEQIAAEYHKDFPITIVRPPAVYGPRERDIWFYFRMLKKGLSVSIGSTNQLLSLVYAPDLADALIHLAGCQRAAGETYFVAHPRPRLWSDISEVILKALGRNRALRLSLPLPIVDVVAWLSEKTCALSGKPALLNRQKMREVRQPFWVCRTEKLQRDAGFVCPTDIENGIPETARWYSEHGWL